jgi:hypothetical protein
MKISRISLDNFRSHRATTLELSRINVFRGPNGVGKSSIEHAIQLAIAGTCEGLSASGAGMQRLVRKGTDKAVVTLHTSHGNRRMTINPSGRTNKDQDWTLTANQLVLHCISNTRYFLQLDEAKQSSLLARLVLPDKMDIPDELRDSIDRAELRLNFDQPPFAFIEAGYKQAFEMRRDVNRDRNEWRLIEYTPAETADVEEVRAKLKLRNDELAKLKADRDSYEKLAREYDDRQSRSGASLDIKRDRLAEEERAYLTSEQARLPKPKLAELKKIAGNAGDAAKLDALIVANDIEIARIEAEGKRLADLLENATCPTCNQALTEELGAGMMQLLVRQKDTQIALKRGNIDARKALGDPQGAARQLDRHEEAVREMERSQRRVAELKKEVAELETVCQETFERKDMAELDAQIKELEARIAKGMEVHSGAALEGQKKRAFDENEAKKRRLDAKITHLEYLVERFSSSGLKAELLARGIGAFQASVNDVLGAFGYQAQLNFEPYSFLVTFAFQVALSLWSGVNFVCIDETDTLDAQGRRALMETLIGLTALEQAICIGTDERSNVPDVDGLSVFMVTSADDGTAAVQVLSQPQPQAAAA